MLVITILIIILAHRKYMSLQCGIQAYRPLEARLIGDAVNSEMEESEDSNIV